LLRNGLRRFAAIAILPSVIGIVTCGQFVSLGCVGLCSFARNDMTLRAKGKYGDGEAVGKAKAEHDDEAMINLLKPSPRRHLL